MDKFSENQKRMLVGLGGKIQPDPRDPLQQRRFPLAGSEIEPERSREAHITAVRVFDSPRSPFRAVSLPQISHRNGQEHTIMKEQRNNMQQQMTR